MKVLICTYRHIKQICEKVKIRISKQWNHVNQWENSLKSDFWRVRVTEDPLFLLYSHWRLKISEVQSLQKYSFCSVIATSETLSLQSYYFLSRNSAESHSLKSELCRESDSAELSSLSCHFSKARLSLMWFLQSYS